MTHGQSTLSWLLRTSLITAMGGTLLCAVLVWNAIDRLWPAYLYAFLMCWLVSVGGMGLLALGNLTGGRWATVGRPYYLAAMSAMPLLAILFVPIGAFADHIYSWTSLPPGTLPPGKAAYLDVVFFCQRAAGYFAVWLVLAWLLVLVSRLDLPPASTPGMRRVGAATLVLLVPTATFAVFDWGMSLEPEWYSSIYGALLTAGGVLAVHALAISTAATIGEPVVIAPLSCTGQLDIDTADAYNDLGNLLLAFLMVNTYFALSQFLIIWSGNLPTEITWYLRRFQGGWLGLALVLVAFHFFVPFLFLLGRDLKRTPGQLRRVALLLIAMVAAHLYWMIVPAEPYTDTTGLVLNVAALVAMFGGWLAFYAWRTNRYLSRCAVS